MASMGKLNRPAPVEVTYKGMRFLITHNPTNSTIEKFLEVSNSAYNVLLTQLYYLTLCLYNLSVLKYSIPPTYIMTSTKITYFQTPPFRDRISMITT